MEKKAAEFIIKQMQAYLDGKVDESVFSSTQYIASQMRERNDAIERYDNAVRDYIIRREEEPHN